jgi:patatin-related protein
MSADNLSNEFRLGIVLYGGVSLAVYENGVARELFRAVKGEGVYTFLKKMLDADIVVDIMSGTSAGGINGIMLGFALASQGAAPGIEPRDLGSSANLWRQKGGILDLLRAMRDPDTTSVLNSTYYHDQLSMAFQYMSPYAPEPGDICSEILELDMFVTGTNVGGKIYTTFDDQGHALDVKDHRQVFMLSYREGRKNDFHPNNAGDLGTLSRITSCFPVAFTPVQIDLSNRNIASWGNLPSGACYLDGGLLNNKPFSSTLDAIYRRTANRVVDRWLIYVEPDPEKFQPAPAMAPIPNVMQAATGALIGIPGYQSISADLENIAEHNNKVSQYWDFCDAIQYKLNLTDCVTTYSATDFSILDSCPGQRAGYLSARFAQLRDRALEGILKKEGHLEYLDPDAKAAASLLVQSFDNWSDPSDPDGIGTLIEFDIYYRMRRLFRLTYLISDLLSNVDEDGNIKSVTLGPEERASYRKLWIKLNHHIKLLEMIQFSMENTVDMAPIDWRDLVRSTVDEQTLRPGPDGAPSDTGRDAAVMPRLADTQVGEGEAANAVATGMWTEVQTLLRSTLRTYDIDAFKKNYGTVSDGWNDAIGKQQRAGFYSALRAGKDESTIPHSGIQAGAGTQDLLAVTDAMEWEIMTMFDRDHPGNSITREYCSFLVVDAHLFPMQAMSGMASMDVIRIVRFSPSDAQTGYISHRPFVEKVCGKDLGHFSGFLKSSWRANDIMWGRLDAVCQLIETIFTEKALRRAFTTTIVWPAADELKIRFQNSTPLELDALAQAAGRLKTALELTPNKFSPQLLEFRELLILCEQREILSEEIPRVIQEAIDQQRIWNNFDILKKPVSVVAQPDLPATLLTQKQAWVTGVRQLDQAITNYAATQLGLRLQPAPGTWQAYLSQYAVGSETWQTNLPKPILLEIALQTAVRLRESLLAAFGDEYARRIRSQLVYKLLLQYPLNAGFYFARSQRTMPEFARTIVWVCFCVSLVMICMSAYFFWGISRPAGTSVLNHFLLFGGPVVMLVFLGWYLRWSARRWRP